MALPPVAMMQASGGATSRLEDLFTASPGKVRVLLVRSVVAQYHLGIYDEPSVSYKPTTRYVYQLPNGKTYYFEPAASRSPNHIPKEPDSWKIAEAQSWKSAVMREPLGNIQMIEIPKEDFVAPNPKDRSEPALLRTIQQQQISQKVSYFVSGKISPCNQKVSEIFHRSVGSNFLQSP